MNGPATALVQDRRLFRLTWDGDRGRARHRDRRAPRQGISMLRGRASAPRVFVYFRLAGNDIVGIHGRAARSPPHFHRPEPAGTA